MLDLGAQFSVTLDPVLTQKRFLLVSIAICIVLHLNQVKQQTIKQICNILFQVDLNPAIKGRFIVLQRTDHEIGDDAVMNINEIFLEFEKGKCKR